MSRPLAASGLRSNWPSLLIAALYLAWSAKFLERASFLTTDRVRHWGIFDDALISMRYAWNLAHGQGLVWNPGERVEGYSNPLTTLLMAAACAAFDRRVAALAVALVGVATVLALAFVTVRLATRLTPRRERESGAPVSTPSTSLVLVSALAFYPLSYWSLSGMETGLVALLFVSSILLSEKWRETGRRRDQVACGTLLGLLCVARPDGILLACLGGLAFVQAARERDRLVAFRRVLLVVAIASLLPILQLVFRLAYYGTALPNTYYLKLGGFPLMERLRGGAAFVAPFLPAALALWIPVAVSWVRAPTPLKGVAVASLPVLVAYQISVGGDPWSYWRIMTPAIPLTAAAAACAIPSLLPERVQSHGRSGIITALIMGVLLAALNAPFLREALFQKRPYQWESNVANVNTALALTEIARPNASVGVFWAGSIPYYTGLRAVDFLGKSDVVIAHLAPDLSGAVAWNGVRSVPGHNKYDLDYSVVRLRPTYVQGFQWGLQDRSVWGRAHYDSVVHRGVPLWIKRNAAEIDWHRVTHDN